MVLTYLLTPWCRVLLEKLTGLQLVKTFPAFHRTRRFITTLTSVRHLSLSWASPIQSMYPHPTSWRSILILSTHLHLGLPSTFPFNYRSSADVGVIAKISALYPVDSNSTAAPHTYSCTTYIQIFVLGVMQAYLSQFLPSVALSMYTKKGVGFSENGDARPRVKNRRLSS